MNLQTNTLTSACLTRSILWRIGGEIMRKSPTLTQSFTHGYIYAVDQGNGRWKFEWRDHNGKRVRRTVPAGDMGAAFEVARAYNIEIASSKDIPGMKRLKSGMTIREAIADWLSSQTEQKAKTVADYLGGLNAFGVFMGEAFPNITHWEAIKPHHVRDYMSSIESLSWSTRRRRLVILQMISKAIYKTDKERYSDFMVDAAIKLKNPATDDKQIPTNRQLWHLTQWFRKHYPAIWAMLMLEYHAGLRGYEACFLRVQDIDFSAGTISILPTDVYGLKNAGSKRTIPVTRSVLDALIEYRRRAKVQAVSGAFFINHRGHAWTETGICCSRTKAMKAYRAYLSQKKLRGIPESFLLRELRSVFISRAACADVSEITLQKYIGHSGGNVMRKHYIRLSTDDLKRGVVDKLEKIHTLSRVLNHTYAADEIEGARVL